MEFWGKLEIDTATQEVIGSLSLVNHSIDVASVFRELCELPGILRNLVCAAGRTLDAVTLDRLAVFALLHDMGKANLGFQAKRVPQNRNTAGHVIEVAPLLMDEALAERATEVMGLLEMANWFGEPEMAFHLLLAAVSHHGKPAFDLDIVDGMRYASLTSHWKSTPVADPFTALTELGSIAREAFPLAFSGGTAPLQVTLALEHHFAGLVMLADWLGSHRESFFPFKQEGDRIPWARQQSRKALLAVGLDVRQARQHLATGLPTFGEIFALQAGPKPLQSDLSRADLAPLLIAESDTGSGKTEAALLHFLALFAAGEVDSLYFALPTRVAARELYKRVREAMERVFGDDCPPVLLAVPGYAQVDGESARMLPAQCELWHDAEQAKRERAWSAERPKRFLAAPVAVGTIDQVLFSTIQVPHAHLRAICLERSLLVVDEVHSSDIYMRYLCRRVLARHLAAGGRALLLSATLGSAARAEYLSPGIHPPPPEDFDSASNQPYPSLCAPGTPLRHLPDPAVRSKQVRIRTQALLESPETLLPGLRAAILAGQRVMVVLNTVARAQTLARLADADPLLAPWLFTVNGETCPHHGRFARPDRELLDKEVSRRMGKGSPAGPILLIGTQTLEQSLDIDADWLMTDLCPIDVLLQRIGRLHRHDRGARPMPICTVLLPLEPDFSTFLKKNGEMGRGSLAGFGFVYEDLRVLQLTRDWVAGEPEIQIPRDNRHLVEFATHPERLATLSSPKWLAHAGRLEGSSMAQTMAANNALIPEKHFGDFLFPQGLEANLATRLGLNDRTISLGGRYTSPFGQIIEEINLPGHLARGLDEEQAHLVSQSGRMLLIHVGEKVFCYSHFGLEKFDESVA